MTRSPSAQPEGGKNCWCEPNHGRFQTHGSRHAIRNTEGATNCAFWVSRKACKMVSSEGQPLRLVGQTNAQHLLGVAAKYIFQRTSYEHEDKNVERHPFDHR